MPSYLIKICGNKYAHYSQMVARYEPDFMGWIFAQESPRYIEFALLKESHLYGIKEQYPKIKHVAVFTENSSSIEEIMQIADSALFDCLQVIAKPNFIMKLHKYIASEWTDRDIPIWPALRVQQTLQFDSLDKYSISPLYVLDAFVPGLSGGTGKRIETEWISAVEQPYLLAGGLNPTNVKEALCYCHACGADVSSGLEIKDAKTNKYLPGHKDESKVRAFIENVRNIK